VGRGLRGWRGIWGYRVVRSRVEGIAVHSKHMEFGNNTCIAISSLESELRWLVPVTFRV